MIGKEVLNYRIVSLIGKGGMGSVYLAEHTLIKNEKVAIKVINADMANDFTRSLLRDEAEHLAGLNHSNIVAFKNYHIDEMGNIFLVMEYADGKNLESYINNVSGLIVEDRICPMFEPILDAVGYAHKKKVLHRDIKPANIVITTEGIPKILDFGIAKIIKNKQDEEKDNVIMGTPSYMSPEQIKGEHLDERSDIYSLGVLLHHMLTGNPPYDTTTLTEQQINTKVVEEELPRMRTYYKYVSDKVQAVVDKATAKDPDKRYKTCDEFKKALHSAIYPPKMSLWTKCAIIAASFLLICGCWYAWDFNRIKTYYYKDYVEVWGVPEGIGELSKSEHAHSNRSYKFVYQKRKLLSVSHVNSLDYLIEDGESERNERPIYQSFTYTAEGKVSRVIVKDRCGKTLYVKSYNAKLNTMAFQYDDEHGTEKVISNQTIGYGRALENNADKGRISRWWIEYDENGYTTSIRYAGLDNSPVGDDNGIYGRKYVRDEKGRTLEIHYIGMDGQPKPTKWGLGIKKFFYDVNDNWIKSEYLTVDGKPAFDDFDGVSIYTLEYDENSNVTCAMHLDAEGNPMFPKKHNIAGVRYIYDDRGFEVTTEYLGIDRKPMLVKGFGVAIVNIEHDEHGYICKRSYYDPDGNPVDCIDGNSSTETVNDEHGNPIETWFRSRDGKLCEISVGYAGYKAKYDSVGNQIEYVTYDVNQKPCEGKDGTYGYTCEFNDKNLITKFACLGVDLKPAPDNNNVIIIHYEYDKRGNNIKMTFYNADDKTLRLSNEGCAGWNDMYDDNGNHLERAFFDEQEKPLMPSGLHYAKVKYTYDNRGYLNSVRYYNLNDGLTPVDGIAGTDFENDERGNVLQETPIGIDGKLAKFKLISKYKYDEFDNMVEQSLYSNSGPDVNSAKIHKYVYKYNNRNQIIEMRYYGTDGKMVLSSKDKIAMMRAEYNDKGERIKSFYYGIDGKPCKCDEGWSSSTYEYDQFGNTIKQCFFDVNGNPTDPKDMVPVGICEYDKWGNMIYIAAQDGHGNFIKTAKDTWAIARFKRDNKGNLLEESYYDEQDKPIICNNGYHKAKCVYDKQGRKTEVTFYGKDGNPSCVQNVHKKKMKYADNSDDIIEESYYGKNGKPVNCTDGYHKIVTTYNEDYTLAMQVKLYNANGTLLRTMKWNGSQWILVEANYNWQKDARDFASELPLDLGSEVYGLVIKSLTITGDNSCEMKFTFPYVTSQLSSDEMKIIKTLINELVDEVEKSLKHKPYVTGTLYDKNNNCVYSYRK